MPVCYITLEMIYMIHTLGNDKSGIGQRKRIKIIVIESLKLVHDWQVNFEISFNKTERKQN